MSLSELSSVLDGTGLPVVYDFWPEGEAPALPWICYRETGSSNLFADGRVYLPVGGIHVDLYTALKDPNMESRVEAVLDEAGLPWDKVESYVSAEHCYKINYQIEV